MCRQPLDAIFWVKCKKRKFELCLCSDEAKKVIAGNIYKRNPQCHEHALFPYNRNKPNPEACLHVECPYPKCTTNRMLCKCGPKCPGKQKFVVNGYARKGIVQ